ncbi:MAG: quinolinate synthase NadA [Bacteroidota bacterium]|nr:quinolinate synthase NadA [Bacteroidota bacterium]
MSKITNIKTQGYIKDLIPENFDFVKQIKQLKKEKNAIILAHFYVRSEIQDIADYTGDSLGLARMASETDADIIVFAGVHFMAETAKILSPEKKVLLPDLNAGCSMADSCEANDFKQFLKKYPDHTVVSYVNTTAEVKTMTDIMCTSSNAKEIINSIPKDEHIVFAPDRNLGNYVSRMTGREMVIWDGACHVHVEFSLEGILELKQKHKNAQIIAHPECEAPVLKIADFIGSTGQLIEYTEKAKHKTFIVATEPGVIHEMKKKSGTNTYIPAPGIDSDCACSECEFMKLHSLEKIYSALKHEQPEIVLSNETINKAVVPINRMLEISEKLNI